MEPLFAVLGRSHSGKLPEGRGKMGGRGKAEVFGNLRTGEIGMQQQLFGRVQAFFPDIGGKSILFIVVLRST